MSSTIKEMWTYNLTTLTSLYVLAQMYLTGIRRTSVSSKKKLKKSLFSSELTNWAQVDFLHKQTCLSQGP